MESFNKNKYIPLIFNNLKYAFGLIFIISAYFKINDITVFKEAINNFKLLNEFLIQTAVYLIPVIELLGFAVIVIFKTFISTQLITFLTAIFTAVIIAKLFEGAGNYSIKFDGSNLPS